MQFAPSGSFEPPKSEPVDYEFAPQAPHDLDAEQGFLGSLLMWNDLLDDVSHLRRDQFWDPLHGFIFDAASAVIRSGRKATYVTLKEALEKAPPVDEKTSALQYLGKLAANHFVSQDSARSYAQRITDLHVRRGMILAGEELSQAAREASVATAPLTLIEEMEARLFALANESASSQDGAIKFDEAIRKAIAGAQAAYQGGMSGIPTGFTDLDAKLGGLHKSDLVIIAGRPSMGKTALVTNISVNVAMSGAAVDFYSLEMSDDQIAMRVLAEKAGIPAEKFRSGRASEAEMKALIMASQKASSLPLYIDKTGGISISQLVSRARRNKRKRKTELIVVDYLQLMQPSSLRRNGNRTQDITEITTGLKALAKELDVPILALSQLNRAVDHREDKRPQLADLRESGSIEQDADVVMFVFREEYYVAREEPGPDDPAKFAEWQTKLQTCSGKAEVIIGKQRHGPIGTVPLAFNGALTKFSSLAKEGRP